MPIVSETIETSARAARKVRGLYGAASAILEHRILCARGKDVHVGPSVRRKTLSLGSGDGRWVVCPDNLNSDSVVYSVGIGKDITFDTDLIRRFGCIVQAFDPTPLAMEWLRSQELPENFVVHPWGLAAHDGSAVFALPVEHAVSFTMSADMQSKATAECPVYRLSTIRDMLKHDHIDLLKLDIEGAEYEVLDDVVAEGSRISQLLIEFHHRWTGSPTQTERAISRIEECGLLLFHVSARGLEYSFIR